MSGTREMVVILAAPVCVVFFFPCYNSVFLQYLSEEQFPGHQE